MGYVWIDGDMQMRIYDAVLEGHYARCVGMHCDVGIRIANTFSNSCIRAILSITHICYSSEEYPRPLVTSHHKPPEICDYLAPHLHT